MIDPHAKVPDATPQLSKGARKRQERRAAREAADPSEEGRAARLERFVIDGVNEIRRRASENDGSAIVPFAEDVLAEIGRLWGAAAQERARALLTEEAYTAEANRTARQRAEATEGEGEAREQAAELRRLVKSGVREMWRRASAGENPNHDLLIFPYVDELLVEIRRLGGQVEEEALRPLLMAEAAQAVSRVFDPALYRLTLRTLTRLQRSRHGSGAWRLPEGAESKWTTSPRSSSTATSGRPGAGESASTSPAASCPAG